MVTQVEILGKKAANAWLKKYSAEDLRGSAEEAHRLKLKNVLEIKPHPKGVLILYEDY